jgi:predicted secreted protein
MRLRPLTVLIAAALAALPGCGGGGGGTKTVQEPRGTVTVEKGQTLLLAFSNNPGIGFDWERGAPNPDPTVLRPRGSRSDSADRPGASVEIRYRFEARRAGTAAIGFVHFFRGKVTERRTVRVAVR